MAAIRRIARSKERLQDAGQLRVNLQLIEK